jgi:hypothetical protein
MLTLQTPRLSFLARRSRQRSVACGASRFTTVIAAAFVCLVLPATGRADWEALGGSLNAVNAPETLEYTQEMASVGGTPWVAWVEPAGPPPNPTRLRVASWNGTSWVQRGSDLNVDPALPALIPSIANVGGVPYVAWVQPLSFGADLRVARWNAATSAWDLVGGPLEFGSPDAYGNLPMIRDIGGEPHVLFVNVGSTASPPGTLEVKRWNGTAWVSVGGAVASNVGVDMVGRGAISGAGGDVYVVWTKQQSIGGFVRNVLHTARFDGTDWVDAGSPAHAGATDGFLASIADIDGDLGIAWFEIAANGKYELRVAVRDVTWRDVGPAVDDDVTFGFSDGPFLLEIGGIPHVAWGQDHPVGDLRVARFAGGAWSLVGSPQRRDLTAAAGQPSLADLDGFPAVAWRELTSLSQSTGENTYEIHASRIGVPPPPPLETTITGNSTATNAGVAFFAFTATPPAGATFECSLDAEPFAACVSPYVSPVLDPGAYTFRVRASNANGTDPTPAVRDFIVDRVAPTTTIRLSGNQSAQGAFGGSATVDADVTDPPLSSGIRNTFCLVDPPTPPTSFGSFGSQPCGVVVTAVGTHTAYAIANDEAGNESAIVSATFLIAEAPDTIFTEGPSGLVSSLPVTWSYRTTVPGSTFECQLDSEPFRECGATRSYIDLPDGPHTFAVRAVGPTGIVDPTPATRSITVGPKQITGACSGTFPFGDPFSLSGRFSTGGVKCVALQQPCPTGSTCSVTLTAGVTDADITTPWSSLGLITAPGAAGGSGGSGRSSCYSTPQEEYDINRNLFPNDPLQRACPQAATFSVLGPALLTATCEVSRSVFGSGFHSRGPDEQRLHTCAATMEIRPRHILSVTVTGKVGATTVPGPGELAITGALVGVRSARAPGAAIQAVTVPAPAFKMKKRVKAEGVVRFRLGLKGEARRLYKAGSVIEIELTTTFAATDGMVTTTQEVVTLQRPEKPRRKLRAKGPIDCTIFAGLCP